MALFAFDGTWKSGKDAGRYDRGRETEITEAQLWKAA